MKKSLLEKLVENGVSFLSEFFPKASTLYVPLLSASIVWTIKRAAEWKEKILSWKVWADPEYIETKPDAFILEFFKSHPALSQSYQDEIQKSDMESLREAFRSLYPILGLEDPFLTALFAHELESKNYRKMAKELGLPSRRISRDNDLQIIFCYQRLKERLSPEQWAKFFSSYCNWVERWNWPDPETPDWKKR